MALWIIAFSLIAVAASGAAAWQGHGWGVPAFVLLVGIAVVSILVVLSIIVNRSTLVSGEDFSNGNAVALGASFMALSLPSLIVRDGRSVLANPAYMDLAETLGVQIVEGEPPIVDSLFRKNNDSVTAAIFRLHHTSKAEGVSSETVQALTEDGPRVFNIVVSPLDTGQLWQIEEQFDTGSDGAHLLAQAPVGLFTVREDGSVLDMNAVLRGWLGYDGEALPENMPENMAAFIDDPATLLGTSKTLGRVVQCDTQIVTRKGVSSPTVMSGSWHSLESGDVYASVVVHGHSGCGTRPAQSASVSQNGASTAEMATGLAAGMDVLGEAPFGVIRLDRADLNTAKLVGVNTAFTQMTGHSAQSVEGGELEFKALFADLPVTKEFLEAGVGMEDGPIDVHLANDDNCPVNVYFSKTQDGGYVAYMIDVSKRKELEDRLMQSQKMQAIGQLAGGVAHDFNNLLTVIRLNTDELLGRHPIGDPSYPELQQINQTVARSAGLVRKLLAFSRKQTLRVEVLNVTDTVSDLSVMLKQVMVERVRLEVVHGRNLPPIRADKTQLETILMNLCVNARDAMVEKGGGGTIMLSSSFASPEDYVQDNITAPKEGGFVIIKVADTGTGMDADVQKKIFEPFFTTKEQGKGTGLGLATVYGIVEQSGGHLRVESTLGVGTTFRVYIPTASKEDLEQHKPKTVVKPENVKPADLAGQGRILFVEDEDAVRAIAAKTLRKRGYTVIEACDGDEAYEILEDGDSFDLMISDVVMPGMDGPTLLKKGRKLLGDARIVFISGYAEEEFSDLLAEEPDVTFLPKPFTLTQLAEKVKSVIGDAG